MNKILKRGLYIGLSALMVGSLAGFGNPANVSAKRRPVRVTRKIDRRMNRSNRQTKKQAKQPTIPQLQQAYNKLAKLENTDRLTINKMIHINLKKHSKRLANVINHDKKIFNNVQIRAALLHTQLHVALNNRKNTTYVEKRTRRYVFLHLNNGKQGRMLTSRYQKGTWRTAKRTGFAKGPTLDKVITMFSKYLPNDRRAIVPRSYKIMPDKTAWLVGRPTKDINKINHLKNVYYYNGQFKGWANIGYQSNTPKALLNIK